MRTIHTFILRLLADVKEPDVLRGSLQPVPEAVTLPFVGEEALLALLHDAARQAAPLSRLEMAENEPIEVGEEGRR